MLKDLVLKNRSYRGYDEQFWFTEQQLIDLIDYARLTPSSVNAQPFCYYPVWAEEEVRRIRPLTHWAKGLPQLTLPHPGMEPLLVIALGKPAETIVLTEVEEDGDIAYYRDEKDVHYVPKRRLEDIICKKSRREH